MPLLVAAPDKFRGTATAGEAAAAMARAAERGGWSVVAQPLSDGGEGLLEVFAGRGLELRAQPVCGPLRTEVVADWRTDGRLAVVEMARASGLSLAGGPPANDALLATSVGTGQLIAAAVDAVAPGGRVLVGLGGSASTDGGWEAFEAVRDAGGLRGAELVGACDVRIDFVEAARVFAPQKGATAGQVTLLERRLEELARRYRDEVGIDVTHLPGSGAAGGFGAAIVAMGGVLRSGYELVADTVGLGTRLAGADLVMTGEGSLDDQSFLGKVVGGVLADAERAGSTGAVVAGRVGREVRLEAERRGLLVESLVDRFGPRRAMTDTVACIGEAAEGLLRTAAERG